MLSGEQRKHVARIGASGRHLLSLVNEVLDLSKIEAGAFAPQFDVAEAGATAGATLALVQSLAEAKGVGMAMKPTTQDVAYVGDEDRVRQILVNLLNNAVKFTDAGGAVELAIGVTTKPDFDARLAPGSYAFGACPIAASAFRPTASRRSSIRSRRSTRDVRARPKAPAWASRSVAG